MKSLSVGFFFYTCVYAAVVLFSNSNDITMRYVCSPFTSNSLQYYPVENEALEIDPVKDFVYDKVIELSYFMDDR